jgi:hypothetical protein
MASGQRSVLVATLAGLEGDATAATEGFRAGLRALRDTWSYLYVLDAQIAMVRVLGPGSPDGRTAAAEAAETIDRLGATALQRLLDEAVQAGREVAAAARQTQPAVAGRQVASTADQ